MATGLLMALNVKAQTNLALDKPVTVSSTFSEEDQYAAKNAVDGKDNTRWFSKYSYAQWLYVDLGAVVDIHKVVVKWGKGAARTYALKFEVQISDDAVNWSTLESVEGNADTENIFDKLSAKARFVKINGLGRSGNTGYAIRELEIY